MEKKIPTIKITAPSRFEFLIDTVSIETCPAEKITLPHKHDFYEILWVPEAGGIHYVDSVPHEIKNDSVFFISPGRVHFFKNFNQVGAVLAFSKEFLDDNQNLLHPFFSFFFDKPYLILEKKQKQQLDLLFRLIKIEFKDSKVTLDKLSSYSSNIIRTHLKAVLLYLKRIVLLQNQFPKVDNDRIIYFFQLVESHYKTEQKVTFYADKMNISTNQLNLILKKNLGKTSSKIIYDRIVLEAKRLFTLNKLTFSEIGYELNFEDPSYFSRFIKKNTNLSPSELKASLLAEIH